MKKMISLSLVTALAFSAIPAALAAEVTGEAQVKASVSSEKETKENAEKKEKEEKADEKAKEAKEKADEKAKETKEKADEKTKEEKEKADEKAKEEKEKADEKAKEEKEKADEKVKEEKEKADEKAKETKEKADEKTKEEKEKADEKAKEELEKAEDQQEDAAEGSDEEKAAKIKEAVELKKKLIEMRQELKKATEITEEVKKSYEELIDSLAEVSELKQAIEVQKELLQRTYQKGERAAFEKLGKLYAKSQDDQVKAFVNGEEPVSDVAPFIKGGRAMVPVRAISSSLKADVKWDGKARSVLITKGDISITLYADKNEALVNGEIVKLDSAPVIKNGRVFLPLRFVGEQLKAKVDWVEEGKIIIIEDQDDQTGTGEQDEQQDGQTTQDGQAPQNDQPTTESQTQTTTP